MHLHRINKHQQQHMQNQPIKNQDAKKEQKLPRPTSFSSLVHSSSCPGDTLLDPIPIEKNLFLVFGGHGS
jgi:hypothetical protein